MTFTFYTIRAWPCFIYYVSKAHGSVMALDVTNGTTVKANLHASIRGKGEKHLLSFDEHVKALECYPFTKYTIDTEGGTQP